MIFGNKTTFAIEAMIAPDLKPPSAPLGRMCIWCEDISIGDINEEHCGLEAIEIFSSLIPKIDSLWLAEFEGKTDLELWDFLDGILYGYHGDVEIDDQRTIEQMSNDASKYSRFSFLTNWGEQFDKDGKSFIFHHPEGKIKILNKDLENWNGMSLSTSKEAFCYAIREAASWFIQQQQLLSNIP